MLKKTKSKLASIKKGTNGSMEQSNISKTNIYPSGKWYQNIHECPLSVFIICLCDGILTSLIISGSVTENDLQEAWKNIHQDYSDSLISESDQAVIIIEKKIVLLERKIAKAYAIQTYLSFKWDEEMESDLLRMGAVDGRYPQNENLKESWWKRLTGRIKRWEVELEAERRRRYLLRKSTTGVAEKVTREVFQDFIVQIEKHVRFSIKESETTVGRFLAMVKDFQKHVISLSKSNKK